MEQCALSSRIGKGHSAYNARSSRPLQGTAGQVKSVAQVKHISNADNWPIYRALRTVLSHCHVAALQRGNVAQLASFNFISFLFLFLFFWLNIDKA